MHVHLPKPLHGWRAFVGEVGIIVIAVLIALAAEQAVEALHWRNEAREFRRAVDREEAVWRSSADGSRRRPGCVGLTLETGRFRSCASAETRLRTH